MKNRKFFFSIISGLLVASFVLAPVTLNKYHSSRNGGGLEISTAHAGWATEVSNEGDWWSNIYNGIIQGVTKGYTGLIQLATDIMKDKELWRDGIVWALINMMIQQMIRSVTRWVASGFAGSPSFVTDLKGFLMSIGDQVAGQWIAKNVPLLCSPFQLNIRMALIAQYQQTTRPRVACTLTGSMQNVRNFTNGSFRAGGWQQWFNVALTPSNNQYGAALDAQFAMDASIRTAQGQEFNLLKFGQGFFSKKRNGEVVNPGKMVEDQLNRSLGLAGDRLVVADEINELLAAFFNTLVSNLLSSGDGLAGMGGSTGSGLGSDTYWDNMAAQSNAQGAAATAGQFAGGKEYVVENNNHQATIISLITNASTYMSTRYPTCTSPTGTLTPSLQTQLTNAQNKTTSNNIIINQLDSYQSDYNALSNGGDPALLSKYSATSAIEAQGNLLNALSTYKSSVGLPGTFMEENAWLATGGINTPMYNLQAEITAFTAAIDTACRTTGTASTTPIT